MKDTCPEMLESSRPDKDPAETIRYCLQRLYADTKHSTDDEVAPGLTYEELIGALLQARDLAAPEIENAE